MPQIAYFKVGNLLALVLESTLRKPANMMKFIYFSGFQKNRKKITIIDPEI
jgi:hypothetical protein